MALALPGGCAQLVVRAWTYVGGGLITRTWTLTLPTTVGAYEFRLFSNNTFNRLATSPAITVANLNPVPTLFALAPPSIAAGSAAFSLSVAGTGFVSSSIVQFDGTARPTTFVASTGLNATISAADVASLGTHTITVVNPAPGGGITAGQILTVTTPPPAPTLTSISPTSLAAATPGATVTVTGTNFIGTSYVQFDGAARPTSYTSATQLSVTLSAADLAAAGTHTLTVATAAPGGGVSAGVSLQVIGPLLAASATQASPGAAVTATLTNGTGNAGDWLSLAVVGAPDSSNVTWTYVGGGLVTRTWTVTLPTALGAYEFRLYSNNTFTRLATSPSITVANLNPIPTVTSLSPANLAAGSATFSLTVTGTGFVNSSVVQFAGAARPTTFVSATQLTATIDAADVAAIGGYVITVFTPAPGGGRTAGTFLTVTAPPAAPALTAVSPTSLPANTPGATLTLTGTNFVGTSVVQFDAAARPTTYISATQLAVTLSAGDLAVAGTHTLMVVTPAPGGGVSGSLSLPVIGPLLGVSATQASPGTPVSVTLTNGTGAGGDWLAFAVAGSADTSYLTWTYVGGGVTTTSWTVTLPAAFGAYEFRLFSNNTFTRLATSPTITDANVNPTPTLTSLSPATFTAGSASFSLTVIGTGFVSGSVLQLDGGARPTTVASASQLTATIAAADVVSLGTHTITVFNPAPGGGASLGTIVVVTPPPPAPTLTSVSPTSLAAGTAGATLTLTGSDFAGTSIVQFDGAARPTTYGSATQLVVTLSGGDLAIAGTHTLSVVTPAPGGGVSAGVTLAVVGPILAVSATQASPGAAVTGTLTNGTGGAGDWLALALNGAADSSYVTWTYVGGGVATRTWTVALPAAFGTYEFRLFSNNTFTRLATSPTIIVADLNPAPTVNSISPATLAAGSASFSLTVNGTGFVSSSIVQFDGTAQPTTVVSATRLTATIAAADVASLGTHTITVVTPTPGGGISAGQLLTVTTPPAAPTLTGVNPASLAAGTPGATLTLTGTNFAGTSVVQFDGAARPTTYSSATQLSVTLTASDLAAAGTHTLIVVTPAPGGGVSGGLTLPVIGPLLAVSVTHASPGAAVTGTLTNGTGGAGDWLALAAVGSADSSFVTWTYVGGGLSTSTWTVTLPAAPGAYEFRLFSNNTFTRLATSPTITVQ